MQHLHPTIAAAQPERQAEQARALAHYGPMAMDALVSPKRRHGDEKAVGAAHTTGPWEAVGSLVRSPRTATGGGLLIAAVTDPDQSSFSAEAKANAQLMAAAPDLLEAGISAAGALQGAADALRMSGHPRTADKLLEMALPLLRALKKATVPA